MKIVKIEPTVLFKKEQNGLMQAVDITIENTGQAVEVQLKVRFRSHDELSVNLGIIKAKTENCRFYVPEISKTIPVKFERKTKNEM